MATIFTDRIHEPLAKQYAEQFGLELVTIEPSYPFLAFHQEQLALFLSAQQKPLKIDWLQNLTLFRNPLLINAIGKLDPLTEIWDATAGFGKDAITLLLRPATVRCFERSPFMAALIKDATLRAAFHPQLKARLAHFHLEFKNSIEALTHSDYQKPEVLYLDPMFETHSKGLPKQAMQQLRALLATEDDGAALLTTGMMQKIPRIVVKRAKNAPFLAALKPTLQFTGESIRFDVYLSRTNV